MDALPAEMIAATCFILLTLDSEAVCCSVLWDIEDDEEEEEEEEEEDKHKKISIFRHHLSA
jgi:hypothetical protein